MDIEKGIQVVGEIRLMTVTQRQMASALKLSPTRINELCNENIIVRDETSKTGQVMLFESLQNYFLSRKTTDEGVNFWLEKARHEKAKRELAELKLQKERGQVYDAAEVESFLTEAILVTRNKLSGLGRKLAVQLDGLKAAQISSIIDAEVDDVLKELSRSVEVRDNEYQQENQKAGGGS